MLIFEQRKRKQTVIKTHISKWKNDEKLSKDLLIESNARLLRPKSVDPGSSKSYICHNNSKQYLFIYSDLFYI